ncbi:unnamed protein product [Vitrella brassicaformis CCMP3155]|uniref:Uncharacterized protein n=1 Tax=Vitrella brassicaformis (strain CCMP3155) TaxID=1169540 RepID=A0A0G4EP71_VITBC|nr:unnamed protein product [Vitrella brassicaformis CCMP3155]|eukprot:CEL99224.1 unnamed protein product [Vitrella brassicaformis CCMP3155]
MGIGPALAPAVIGHPVRMAPYSPRDGSPPYEGTPSRWHFQWSDGVFDCFTDFFSCILGCIFYPSLAGFKAWALDKIDILPLKKGLLIFLGLAITALTFELTIHILALGHNWHRHVTDVWILQFFFAGVWVLFFFLNLKYRSRIRQHYMIEPTDACDDGCLVFFCLGCAVCQEYRHVARATGVLKDMPFPQQPTPHFTAAAHTTAPPAVVTYEVEGAQPTKGTQPWVSTGGAAAAAASPAGGGGFSSPFDPGMAITVTAPQTTGEKEGGKYAAPPSYT